MSSDTIPCHDNINDDIEELKAAETAIRNAILEVEKLVVLLQAAKDSVGDYVDGATKWIETAPIPAESISTAIQDTQGRIVGFRHYGLVNKEVIARYVELASDSWIDEETRKQAELKSTQESSINLEA